MAQCNNHGCPTFAKASKPEFPGSTQGSSCFSLVFIKNLINDKSNSYL